MQTNCFFIVLAILLAASCVDDSSPVPDFSEQQSESLQPANPDLAAIYDRSCKSCHIVAATGAPLTGDAQAWAERLDAGMDTLLDNVINGTGGMPPLGLCMDCELEEFEALIDFMAEAPSVD